MDDKLVHEKLKSLETKLVFFEERIRNLEISLGVKPGGETESPTQELANQLNELKENVGFESQFGEKGLAWIGNIILFMGMAFIMQYLNRIEFPVISILVGFASAAGIYGLVFLIRKSNRSMAQIFLLNALALLFFSALRLHYFIEDPFITSTLLALLIALITITPNFYFVFKKQSKSHAVLALILLSVLASINSTPLITLLIVVVLAVVSYLLLYKYKWKSVFIFGLTLTYIAFFLHMANSPFAGNPFQIIENHNYGFNFLFIIAIVFSLVPLLKQSESITKTFIISSIVLNGIGFSLLIFLYVLSFFPESYSVIMISVSAFCILYSLYLKVKSDWMISASLFVLYGFVTLSVSLYGWWLFPKVYFLLSIQSLLVVIIAIWFRSKFIVLMNTFMYLSLLIFYLATSGILNGVNISFTLVAFITARILNLQKERLTIKTEQIRNTYLFVAFVMMLVSLYHLVNPQYVTLSWALAALVYYGMSWLMKNVKYRFMALATLLSSVFYLFIIDLVNIELIFRILALMVLSAITIGISIYYNKRKKSRDINE